MDTRFTLPVDTVLDDSYRIVRVVGAGGFGITYEAVDGNLGTTVALKEYYPADFGDRDASMSVRPKSQRHKRPFEWGRSNFLEEARTLARFEHPSIVQVMRVFEANSTAYMVMRFEQGQSFEAWLNRLGRLPTQDELDAIVAPLLDALQMMHTADFLHRDIAPDNIIVRADGSPVLLDFGAARRAVAAMSRNMTGIVKAGYSPHEQYSSDSRLQGPWSDLYALGGTLYRAVMGRPPEEVAMRVDEDRMPPAAQAAKKGRYRPTFLTAIDACLRVRPADRPQSVAQLWPTLLGQAPLPRPAPERPAKAPKPAIRRGGDSKRNPPPARPLVGRWVAAAAAMLAVMGGAYGGVEYSLWQPPERGALSAEASGKPAQGEAGRKAAEDAARRLASLEAERRRAAGDTADQEAALATERPPREETERADAVGEARRQAEAEARREEDARARIAAVTLSADERAAFVKRVQNVLKQGRCYDGAVNGRGIDAQEGLDRFVAGVSQKGKARPHRIELAKATAGDFETWLNDADDVKGEICAPKAKPAKQVVAKASRQSDEEEATARAQPAAKPRSEPPASDRPGRGGSCSSWMFHNTSCTDGGGRHCTQTTSGRKCD